MLRFPWPGLLMALLLLSIELPAAYGADEGASAGKAADKPPADAPPPPAGEKKADEGAPPPRKMPSLELMAQAAAMYTKNPDYDALQLIQMEQVQKEIQAKPEQLAKAEQLQAEFDAAADKFVPPAAEFVGNTPEERFQKIQGILAKRAELGREYSPRLMQELQPAQAQRLREIFLQWRGADALKDPDLAKTLKLTARQREQLDKPDEEALAKRRELMQGVLQGTVPQTAMMERLLEIQKTRDADMVAVLTPAQAKQYQKLRGKKFELADPEARLLQQLEDEVPAETPEPPKKGKPEKKRPSAKPARGDAKPNQE